MSSNIATCCETITASAPKRQDIDNQLPTPLCKPHKSSNCSTPFGQHAELCEITDALNALHAQCNYNIVVSNIL